MSSFLINYPKKINKNLFKVNSNIKKTKYGLPKKILYCKKCVISNQRPSSTVEFKNRNKKKEYINFDKDDVCDACRYAEKKNKFINWDHREKELIKL